MPLLSQLAELVQGKLVGKDLEVNDAKTIARSTSTDITFVAGHKHLESFYLSDSIAAVVNQATFQAVDDDVDGCSFVVVEDCKPAFATIVKQFRNVVTRKRIGISPNAFVADDVELGDNVDIYPGAFIGAGTSIGDNTVIYPGVTILENCVIGNHVEIFPNAVLYENTKVGDDSIIHAGAVLGAYGFGYDSSAAGHKLSEQLGNVELGVKVEIGANTTIDRGTFDSTIIGDGTKIDDLVMVGHNNQLGKHNLLCSQVGIAGSCTVGDFVVMAGQVGIGDHLKIGNHVTLMAKAGLMHNVADGQTFLGIPATPVREQMQILAVKAKLPEMRKSLKKLTKAVEQLSPQSQPAEIRKEAA